MECVIHWFRRDLRLRDNTALEGALRTGVPVVPVFILDHRLLSQPTMGERRLQFLRTALLDLDARLRERGSRLLVLRADDPARELNRVAEEVGAWALFFNRDYTPYARWRDTRATRGMQMTGVVTMPTDDLLLVPPLATLGAGDRFPETFAAFTRRWFEALDLEPEPAPVDGAFMAAEEMPAGAAGWEDLLSPGLAAASDWPGATPLSAETRLVDFVRHQLAGYLEGRDRRGELNLTSRLSAALKFGTISVRRVARTAIAYAAQDPQSQPATERFILELGWRDYAHHMLFHRPELLREPLRHPAGAMSSAPVEGGLDAWIRGQTGIPLVDAGLAQMHTEGFMHNRVRMVVASFLAHQLGADWRAGERHFARHLVDHDVASNDLGWQWAVGVGANAAPYRRTLTPRRQGEKFDPGGVYVRQHVPALRDVPDRYIHHPWNMPLDVQESSACRIGIDYPAPVTAVATSRRP
ncbi:MAG: deoxyribodipyrimidine photo-lyase [Candidatus Dormibacteria bacterium]